MQNDKRGKRPDAYNALSGVKFFNDGSQNSQGNSK